MTSPILTAHLGRATLSNSSWYHDQLITFLAAGGDTEGRFALLRVQGVQGAASFAHYHTGEDETIYVLAGEVTVQAGGGEWRLLPGETITIPRGLAHAVRHDSEEVAYLVQFSPAGFERCFHEMSEPAEYLGLPPDPSSLDRGLMREAAERYGCVFAEGYRDI
jgi:quercetin dioxygenase-like cupin family protein